MIFKANSRNIIDETNISNSANFPLQSRNYLTDLLSSSPENKLYRTSSVSTRNPTQEKETSFQIPVKFSEDGERQRKNIGILAQGQRPE